MEIRKERGLVVVELGEAHRAISTLPTPPQIARIAFKQVDKDFSDTYEAEAARVRETLGEDTAVFLTAAKLPESFGVRAEGPISVAATVAMSPTSCVGGTINVAVAADAPLSKWGMVDLLKTAVEAKCLAAVDRLARCNGMRSPGTVTDAVLVAVPVRQGESIHHAGPATELGQRATRLVYELITALDAHDLFERALGIAKREFSQAFAALLKEAPLPVEEGEELRELDKILRDPNVWALILAASELDAMGARGLIPGLSAEEFKSDSPRLIADELLGVALADYLGGFQAVLTTYWVERMKKRGAFRELAPFADDIMSALLASVYLSLYKKTYGRER